VEGTPFNSCIKVIKGGKRFSFFSYFNGKNACAVTFFIDHKEQKELSFTGQTLKRGLCYLERMN